MKNRFLLIINVLSLFFLTMGSVYPLAPVSMEQNEDIRKIWSTIKVGGYYQEENDLINAWRLYGEAYSKYKNAVRLAMSEGRIRDKREYDTGLYDYFVSLRREGYLKETPWFYSDPRFTPEAIWERYKKGDSSIPQVEFEELELKNIVEVAFSIYENGDSEEAQILLEYVLSQDDKFYFALITLNEIYYAKMKKEYFWLTDSYECCLPYSLRLFETIEMLNPEAYEVLTWQSIVEQWKGDRDFLLRQGTHRANKVCAWMDLDPGLGYRIRYFGAKGAWYVENYTGENIHGISMYGFIETMADILNIGDSRKVRLFIHEDDEESFIQVADSDAEEYVLHVTAGVLNIIAMGSLDKEKILALIEQRKEKKIPKPIEPEKKEKIDVPSETKLFYMYSKYMTDNTREYIDAYLSVKCGYEVTAAHSNSLEPIPDLSSYTHLLMSYNFNTEAYVVNLLKRIKKAYPHLLIVVGGVGTIDIGEAVRKLPYADCIIRHEGIEVLERILKILPYHPIDGELNQEQIEALEALDDSFYLQIGRTIIARNMNKLNKNKELYLSARSNSVFLDFGCPYDCKFCNSIKNNYKGRVTVDVVMDYLEARKSASENAEKDLIRINFEGDNLLWHRPFCEDLFKAIIERGYNEVFSFVIGDSSLSSVLDKNGRMDTDFLDLMDMANVSVSRWGIDGRCNAIIRQNNKPEVTYVRFIQLAERYPNAVYNNLMSTPDSNVFDIVEQILLTEISPSQYTPITGGCLEARIGSMFTNEATMYMQGTVPLHLVPKNRAAIIPYAKNNTLLGPVVMGEVNHMGYLFKNIEKYRPYIEAVITKWNSREEEDPELRALGKILARRMRGTDEKDIDYLRVFEDLVGFMGFRVYQFEEIIGSRVIEKEDKGVPEWEIKRDLVEVQKGMFSFRALLKELYPDEVDEEILLDQGV